MIKLSKAQQRKIIKMFNEEADSNAGNFSQVLMDWGRHSEVNEPFEKAKKKKEEFAKFFEV